MQGRQELGFRHLQRQAALSQAISLMRFHGQMQHHLFVLRMGLGGQLPAVGGMGKERIGYWTGQPQRRLADRLLITHVIDDQGKLRSRRLSQLMRLGGSRCRHGQ